MHECVVFQVNCHLFSDEREEGALDYKIGSFVLRMILRKPG